MTKARLDGLYLILLGCVAFVLLGVATELSARNPLSDFKAIYYPARCLIQGGDPYIQSQVLDVYRAEGGDHASDSAKNRQIVTQNQYPPTVFSLSVPFALISWGPAHVLWTTLNFASQILASFLVWSLLVNVSPVLSAALIGFLLANSEVVIITGNAAGIVTSLCAVAVWCFLRERFVLFGILCLAFGLAVKPHDAGLVWLYFLLAGGLYRRRALQALFVTIALSLPAVLWVWHVSPHWIQEMHTNIEAYAVHGSANDPGLASSGAHGLGMVVSLQAIFSVFWDNPHFYNSASYFVCGPLLVAWVFITLRSRDSQAKVWLGLAVIAALSMLPVYHRMYDTKLLILTVPACITLFAEGSFVGWAALAITTLCLLLNGDICWVIVLQIINRTHFPTTGISGQILMAIQVFPAPLILLITGAFYLGIYWQRRSLSPVADSILASDSSADTD
jgi:hypothetical protein